MKRIVLWVLSTLSVLVLLFGYHTSTSGPLATATPPAVLSSGSGSGSGAGSGSSNGSSGSGSSNGSSGSGQTQSQQSQTATGGVASTEWGPVQVELTISGGAITDVSVLQYPNGNGKDVEINSYALPILIQETMDAQSANIQMVSGATVTSTGYIQSLQSALDSAGL